MKKTKLKPGVLLLLAGLLLMLISYIFGIPQGEGFNPSDDGVILAQSFRLLAGQVPHLDFISIRPIGSAVFHSISFVIPMPLELSARWIVLIQYLIYSFLWAWMLFKTMPNKPNRLFMMIGLAVLIFVLNQNHYNLFPWTTIDAIFFFSIGFFIYWSWKGVKLRKPESLTRYFLIILFTGLAALCRQSFALPAIVLGLVVLFESFAQKRLGIYLTGIITGLLPYWIYAFVLVQHDGMSLFIDQMTGRTELWQTGVVKYAFEFWNSPLLILFIFIIGLLLFFRFSRHQGNQNTIIEVLKRWGILIIISIVLLLILLVFLRPVYLFKYSFMLFWLLVVMLIIQVVFSKQNSEINNLSFWVLFVSWTSSISMGDNAPVFTIGLLAGTLIILLIHFQDEYSWLINRMIYLKRVALVLFVLLIVGLGIYSQKSNNYRDLEAKRLHFEIGKVFPGMGRIRTNPRTYQYLTEINKIYNDLNKPVGRFVVLPNASLIYPLLNSQNPFPLDWMQSPEFIGQEEDLSERLAHLDIGEGIFLLFDKFNSKLIADSLVQMDFNTEAYPYYPDLQLRSTDLGIESDWFEVRLLK